MINDTRDDSTLSADGQQALNGLTIEYQPVPSEMEARLYAHIKAKIATTWSYVGLYQWERKFHQHMLDTYSMDILQAVEV